MAERKMTVHEVSERTGVSVRTLQYYDRIGLLPPAYRTEAGYRLYDGGSLEKLEQILLFRELEFPLKEIQAILESPGFDRQKALEQQIRLLEVRREHLDRLIEQARRMQKGATMDFKALDTQKLKEYEAQARAVWGTTEAYREYEARGPIREADEKAEGLMAIFARFGEIRETDPAGDAAQNLVRELQRYITDTFYTCTAPVLRGLGRLYEAGGEMGERIDRAGGAGTAAYAARAIEAFCR